MKQTNYFVVVFQICCLLLLPDLLITRQLSDISFVDELPVIKFIKPDADQLKKLGIVLKDNGLEYVETVKDLSKSESQDSYKVVKIVGDIINFANVTSDDTKNSKSFSPRFVVNLTKDGSSVYYRNYPDFAELKHKNSSDNNAIAEFGNINKLIPVYLNFKNGLTEREIYLWYEASPEFLSALDNTQKDEISKEWKKEETTESTYLNNKTENSFIKSTLVYPNPTRGGKTVFSYELNDKAIVTVGVYDINGNEVIRPIGQGSATIEGKIEFDLSILTEGMYLFIMKTDNNNQAIQRVIVLK